MSAMKETPRQHIVSVRITDKERELLEQISRRTLKTVSEIIRDAMKLATPKLVRSYERNKFPREYVHK